MTATPRNYFNDTQSIISDHPTTKDATVGQTPAHPVDPKPVPAASQRAKSVPKVTAVKKNKFQFFAPIKPSDRKLRLCVYNDDFIRDVPQLYVTRIIVDDEINLDTDEDRGYLTPDVKKMTVLGGAPKINEMTNAQWDEFIVPARTPLKKTAQ